MAWKGSVSFEQRIKCQYEELSLGKDPSRTGVGGMEYSEGPVLLKQLHTCAGFNLEGKKQEGKNKDSSLCQAFKQQMHQEPAFLLMCGP